MIDYEKRRRALETALDELETHGALRDVLKVSISRVQVLVVELDASGEPILPAPWIKWLSSDASNFTDYNDSRLDLDGNQLVDPAEFGTLLPLSHPAYAAVRDDYARRRFRLNKSVRIYGRQAAATYAGENKDEISWPALVEHLVGAVNALPAAQRAMVAVQIHAS